MKPLHVGKSVTKMEDIAPILEAIKQPADDKVIADQTFYAKIHDLSSNLSTKMDDFANLYTEYRTKFQKIVEDFEKLKKIALEDLLQAGLRVLSSGAATDDTCPLCLQTKDRTALTAELTARVEQLNEYKREIDELGTTRKAIEEEIGQWSQKPDQFLTDTTLAGAENEGLRKNLSSIKAMLLLFKSELRTKVGECQVLKDAKDIVIHKKVFDEMAKACSEKIQQLKATRKDDTKFEVHNKIVFTRNALEEIKRLSKEKGLVEKRKISFEFIYADFAKRQKHALPDISFSFFEQRKRLLPIHECQ